MLNKFFTHLIIRNHTFLPLQMHSKDNQRVINTFNSFELLFALQSASVHFAIFRPLLQFDF